MPLFGIRTWREGPHRTLVGVVGSEAQFRKRSLLETSQHHGSGGGWGVSSGNGMAKDPSLDSGEAAAG